MDRSRGPGRGRSAATIAFFSAAIMFGCAEESPGAGGGAGASGEHKPNRLIGEKSPYLLQHAYNPVDWYAWGDEAFEKAAREDKPVFVSIGYSTCHWCHVMERESFDDAEVARILNQHFVAIKVDREERPDVDNIYMSAVQALTGQGGWPLSVFMTPDRRPFFGGTYFPPEDRFGRPGFKRVLNSIVGLWEGRRDKVENAAERLIGSLRTASAPSDGQDLDEGLLRGAFETYRSTYDSTYGGFGKAPKFPRSHTLSSLLRYWRRSGDPEALSMVTNTLDHMARGGMYDHVGGGFHRYSVDAEWLVPHFEKMLYDQAILARTYLEAYQATGDADYARTAREIFDYVLRDMTSPEGGIYSAEDADSEGEEGLFYVWTPEEVKAVLGDAAGDRFCAFYGVTEAGNFEGGKNILHIESPLKAFAERTGADAEALAGFLDEGRRALFAAREKRVHPFKDDKVLTAWNGLMISALSFGAQVLDEPRYGAAAERAADFVLKTLGRDGRLLRRYREGEAGLRGYVDDYAFLVMGLIDLYETNFEPRYLREALRLNATMLELFWDEGGGGLFFTSDDGEPLVVRQKEIYDGAVPSGNSVAALNLLRLGQLTMDESLKERGRALMAAFGGQVARFPTGYPQMLIALDFAVGPGNEIVIAGDPGAEGTLKMVRAVRRPFLPNKVVALHPVGDEADAILDLVPFLRYQKVIDGRPTAYVCVNYTCNLPTTSVEELEGLLPSQ